MTPSWVAYKAAIGSSGRAELRAEVAEVSRLSLILTPILAFFVVALLIEMLASVALLRLVYPVVERFVFG